jgi:hypothetical protein
LPRSEASDNVGPGRLGSVQFGAGRPTRAGCDDEPVESLLARPHPASATNATEIAAAFLTIGRIANGLKVVLHLLDEFADVGKKPLLPNVAELAQG